jgi:hypothetical protein
MIHVHIVALRVLESLDSGTVFLDPCCLCAPGDNQGHGHSVIADITQPSVGEQCYILFAVKVSVIVPFDTSGQTPSVSCSLASAHLPRCSTYVGNLFWIGSVGFYVTD